MTTDFTVGFVGQDDGLSSVASKVGKALQGAGSAAQSAREDLRALASTLGDVFTAAGRADVLSELNTQLMSLSDNIIEFGGSARDVSDTLLMIGQRSARTGESVALLASASRTLVDEADSGRAAMLRLSTAMDVAAAAGLKAEDAGRLVGRAMRGEADALVALGGPAARASDAIAQVADANERARLTMLALDRQLRGGLGPLDRMQQAVATANARLSVMTGLSAPLATLGSALTAVGVAAVAMGGAILGVAVKAIKALAATSADATASAERLARAQDQVWVSLGRAMVGAEGASGALDRMTTATYGLDAAIRRNGDSIKLVFDVTLLAALSAAQAATLGVELALQSIVGPIDIVRGALYSLEGLLYRHVRAAGKVQEALAPAGSEMERAGQRVQAQANAMLSALGPFDSYALRVAETGDGLRAFARDTYDALTATEALGQSIAANNLEKLAGEASGRALEAAMQGGLGKKKGGGGGGRGGRRPSIASRIGAAAGARGGGFLGEPSDIFAGSLARVRAELDALAEADAAAAALVERGTYLQMAGDLSLQLGEALPQLQAQAAQLQEQLQIGEWQRYGDAAVAAIDTIIGGTYRLLDAMAMGQLALKDLGVAAADMGGDMLANLGLDLVSEAVGMFAVKIGAVFQGLGAAFQALASNPIALLGIGAGLVAAGLLLKKFAGSGSVGGPSASGARSADTSAASAVQALGRQLFEGEDRRAREIYLMLDDRTGLRGYIGSTVGDMQARGGTGF